MLQCNLSNVTLKLLDILNANTHTKRYEMFVDGSSLYLVCVYNIETTKV